MNEKYVKDVVGSISEFCDIYNDYETELQNLGVVASDIKERTDAYNADPSRSQASKDSYNLLPDDRKYHDENGAVVEYENLTVAQKVGLDKTVGFIHDESLDFDKEINEASYNMKQSANKFVKNLEDKLREINRANSHLSQINLQNAADIARNQSLINDCLYELPRATDVNEKTEIADRLRNAHKDIKKIEVLSRINTTVMSTSSLIAGVFNNVIDSISKAKENNFDDADEYRVDMIEEKMDIMNDLNTLMTSFQNLKADYEKEKELISSINAKCKEMKKASESKDIKNFANAVMKNTKDYSKLIEHIEEYNKTVGKSETQRETVQFETPSSEVEPESTQEEVVEESKEQEPVEEEKKEEEKTEEQKTQEEKKEEEKTEEQKTEEEKHEDTLTENVQGAQEQTVNSSVLTPGMDAEHMVKVKSSRRHKNTNLTTVLLLAGVGLGFVPGAGLLPTMLIGGAAASSLVQVVDRAYDLYKRNAVNRKLNKIGKIATKDLEKLGYNNFKIKLKELVDPTTKELTGELRYALYENGVEVAEIKNGLQNNNRYPLKTIEDDITKQINEKFKYMNDSEKRLGTRYEEFNYSKVDLENLEAAYVEFGGYKVAKNPKAYDDLYTGLRKVATGIKDALNVIRDDNDRALDDSATLVENQFDSDEISQMVSELDQEEPAQEEVQAVDPNEMAAQMTTESAISDRLAEWNDNLSLEGLEPDEIYNFHDDLFEILNNNVQGYSALVNSIENKEITTKEEFIEAINNLKAVNQEGLEQSEGLSR